MRPALAALLLAACAATSPPPVVSPPPPPVVPPPPPEVEGVWIGTRNGAGCYMLEFVEGGSGLFVQLHDPGDDPIVLNIVSWKLEDDVIEIDLGDRWTLKGYASDARIVLDEFRRRRKYPPSFAFQRWDQWRVMERKTSAAIPGK